MIPLDRMKIQNFKFREIFGTNTATNINNQKQANIQTAAHSLRCGGRSFDNTISFFEFPKVNSIRKKLLDLVRRENLEFSMQDKLKQNPIYNMRRFGRLFASLRRQGPKLPAHPYPTLFEYNNFKISVNTRTTKKSCSCRVASVTIEPLSHLLNRNQR